MKKEEARKIGMQARKMISAENRATKEKKITEQMRKLIDCHEHIAFYMPIGYEVNIREVIYDALNRHRHVYLPKVDGDTLRLIEVHDLSDLKPGAFHIPEPHGIPVEPSTIDLMFVPLTSFDHNGNRTGYGKGYYDSILKKISFKVGVAFEEQSVACIDVKSHDVQLDDVIHA